jgi:hypothetical protein
MLQKVISGGQTGADRAGLNAAQRCGLATGGTAPANYLTENGPDDSLRHLGLIAPANMTYPQRTQANVINSDGTIAFRANDSPGTNGTISYCHSETWLPKYTCIDTRFVGCFRPVFVITGDDLQNQDRWPELVNRLVSFITRCNIKTLNIAGNRQTSSEISNFMELIETLLTQVFQQVK